MHTIGSYGHDLFNFISWAIEFLYMKVGIHAYKTSTWIAPFNKLSTVLYEVYDFLVKLDGYVIGLRGQYDLVVERLNSILDTSGLETLIERLFDEWNAFRTSPKDYISGKMYELVDTWGSLKDDANRWVMYRIQGYDWFAWEWLTDPVRKLLDWLSSESPILYKLITEPAQGLRDALEGISHQAYQLVTDPVEYLKAWFIDSLGWSGDFWADPWRYLFSEILESIERRIGEWKPELTRKGERIIRFLWEGRM